MAGRNKLEESKKRKRVDVFIEQEKIDLIGKKECSKIAKQSLEAEYDKLILTKIWKE